MVVLNAVFKQGFTRWFGSCKVKILFAFRVVIFNFYLGGFYSSKSIGLLITDLRMPEESGMSLIKRLREHTSRQHLPVIVTSGHADMEDVSDMLRLQVLDLFRKPIYHVRLLETLDNLFPKARTHLG